MKSVEQDTNVYLENHEFTDEAILCGQWYARRVCEICKDIKFTGGGIRTRHW